MDSTWAHHLPLASGLPFLGILLSIALIPLWAEKFWHRHFGKIALFWATMTAVFFLIYASSGIFLHELFHIAWHEYIPFITLLFALFTISGGFAISGPLVGSTRVNVGLIAIGTLLASWIGTTGAAMVLIRPLIKANQDRKHRVHTIVFFIFLVANIGGALTPLGDPPLFLGFLKGVPFFWPTIHLFLPTLCTSVILIAIYTLIDQYYIKKETISFPSISFKEIRFHGRFNAVLILIVIGAVLSSGLIQSTASIELFHTKILFKNLLRDIILWAAAGVSWWLTPKRIREMNHFSWFPIVEVAKLFAGIFVTLAPVIALLKLGEAGPFSGLVTTVKHADGALNNLAFFWITGILSSFLDNAPTYLVFFNLAAGDQPQLLWTSLNRTLAAISMGAVYMGAMTYIGNAPNFMVRSIAEKNGVKMPSFIGYYFKYAIGILGPVLVIVGWLFV